ncbi:MAG: uroporphyrinogen decarboxylase [Chlorobi bacterium]|nr:uroporphyrinogen decarboxylase [Chlorobiota bacterium]
MKIDKVELVGYAATVVLIASFAIDDFLLFRIVNSVGCFLFILYGILKKATPVTITNLAIVSLNLYYIIKYLYFSSPHS